MTATLSRYRGSLCLDVDGVKHLLGPKDAWRVVEAWSICAMFDVEWSLRPIGYAGRRDYGTIYFEIICRHRRFLAPYTTCCEIMNGELKEAMAIEDFTEGPAQPAPGMIREPRKEEETQDRREELP